MKLIRAKELPPEATPRSSNMVVRAPAPPGGGIGPVRPWRASPQAAPMLVQVQPDGRLARAAHPSLQAQPGYMTGGVAAETSGLQRLANWANRNLGTPHVQVDQYRGPTPGSAPRTVAVPQDPTPDAYATIPFVHSGERTADQVIEHVRSRNLLAPAEMALFETRARIAEAERRVRTQR